MLTCLQTTSGFVNYRLHHMLRLQSTALSWPNDSRDQNEYGFSLLNCDEAIVYGQLDAGYVLLKPILQFSN